MSDPTHDPARPHRRKRGGPSKAESSVPPPAKPPTPTQAQTKTQTHSSSSSAPRSSETSDAAPAPFPTHAAPAPSDQDPNIEPPEPTGAPDSPAVTAAPPVPRLDADTGLGEDCLGVDEEARAFARIIASRRTEAPLSIGLFGDWGSGKSFFMGLMQRELEARCQAFTRMAELGDADERAALGGRWHGRIAQITFNAWHYAEPNLWASLVTRVFDALAEQLNPDESIEDTRARLLAEVSEGKQRRDQARLELRNAEEQLAEARAERELRQAELAELREELAVVEAVEAVAPEDTDAPGTAAPGTAARALGEIDTDGPTDTTDTRSTPPTLRVRGRMAAFRVTLRWMWSHSRWTRLLVILVVALTAGCLGVLMAWGLGLFELSSLVALALSVVGLCSPLVGTISTWVTRIRPRLDVALRAYEAAKRAKPTLDAIRQDVAAFPTRAVTELLAPRQGLVDMARRRVERAQVEVDSASLAIEQATDQIARRRRLLHQLQGGRRFYDFISDREQSDDYRQHLGLVSLIREDFEHLERILDQIEREGAGDDAPTPISRIVLYIDDLDRCEPERVVEVLQAVHLLLATPIFVVVVAVDVRWLRRSLTLHYDRLLQTPGDGQRGHPDESRPTPKNYLEKIFQIPFSLRPMGPEGFSALVHNLVRPDASATTPADRLAAHLDEDRHGHRHDHELASDVVVSLDPGEIAFMQSLHGVIDTPRLAKSLVNTYRLLRAELPPTSLEGYLEDGEYRGVLILLAIQVGRSREATILFDALGRTQAPMLLRLVAELRDTHDPQERWAALHQALVELDAGDQFVARLVPWVDRIRRFSFNPWPTG